MPWAIFLLAYGLAAWLKVSSLEKAGVILGLYILSWVLWDRTLKSVSLALTTAVIGSGIESLLGYLGLYMYTAPDSLGVPLWLPILYIHASAAVGALGRTLRKNTL